MVRLARLARRVPRPRPEALVTAAVVGAAVGFILVPLQPGLVLTDTTPAGGDTGAHVWGPAFLRDHLLPGGRLTGWSPDWFAGFPAYHFYMVLPSLAIVALDLVLPYGVAFKVVTVSGLLALPVAAWALGRLARAPFPTPALLAVATVPFVFDRSFTIYGGNAASTLAGEFAFAISLSLALVYLGVLARGLETGRRRAVAAVLLALCALTHVIPALFALGGTAVLVLLRRPERRRLWYVATAGGVGAALAAFWALPFVWRRGYMTDMGWEKLTTYWEALLPGGIGTGLTRLTGGAATAQVNGDITLVAILALVGLGVSVAFRRRLGTTLGVLAVALALAFVLAPQSRLWNARLLPFWYLCLYLLAAVAAAELARSIATLVARRPERPSRVALAAAPAVMAVATLVVVGLPLRALPFGRTSADGTFTWAGLSTTDASFIPDWARWNYSGYERKDAYPEYRALVDTMAEVGTADGCGRAMWEYEAGLNRFGTPMALMLLPYWTDGCIGSMEGLYFESSATTPYHFLTAAEVSAQPSNPQRGLAYGSLDVAAGVDHLQMLGVRYYMAFSPEAVRQADAEPGLFPVARSGSWRVYEVADADLVEPLEAEPVVVTDVPTTGKGWEDMAVDWYLDPSNRAVMPAASGPPSWDRVERGERVRPSRVPDTAVSAVEAGTDTISFRVDRTGAPVLVKASYFPNWQASGADGPYRVAPNLMVVVPTDTTVELSYGTTPVDWLGWAVTVLGLVGLVILARRPALALAEGRGRRGGETPPPAGSRR
ncbi:MAG: hypothetical protein ACRDZ9_02675, partial [Acidimicrobiales bacterium]